MYTYPLSWLQAAIETWQWLGEYRCILFRCHGCRLRSKHGSDRASVGILIRCHGCRLRSKHGSDWARIGVHLSVVMVAGCVLSMAVIGRV